jgi:MoaA/NifB/PqqE/SkfB family radical SAM enzyme
MAAEHDLVNIGMAPADLKSHRIANLPVLVLHVHSSCNSRCVMCDIWKTKESRSLRPSDLESHLESMRQLGVRWVVFSGGEPLLNPEFPQLCAMLRRENIRVTLLTTGLLLQKLAGQVAESFDDAIVSLDGPEGIHDLIRRVDGAFSMIGSGVRAVQKRRTGFSFTARTTVQKGNHRHLRETVEGAKILNMKGISFLPADLTSEAFNRPVSWSAERQREVALSMDELAVLENEIDFLIDGNAGDIRSGYIAESPDKLRRIARHFRAHLGLDRDESPQCNAPWTSAVVEADGTVRPCFFHRSIGNINRMTLEEVVNGMDALVFRSTLDIRSNLTCNRCVCSLNYRRPATA